jgi:hypothetical protein
MAVLPTIAETVTIGDISTYLSGNDNARGSLFGPRLGTPVSPVLIALVTDALRWGNTGGAIDAEDLRSSANYLIWLCGKYALQARSIMGIVSGGGVTVTPGGGGAGEGFPLYVVSADFDNATEYTNEVINGKNIFVYMNEINRLLTPNTEFSVSGGTVTILIPGFDATVNDYHFVIDNYKN